MATCRKCSGTGRGPWRADGGRCWHCDGTGDSTPVAREVSADDEAYATEMGFGLTTAERVAIRRAKREARK
jgi:hypothetical protein